MRILVGCEFSGIVRDAFRTRGHDAISCDLLPSERPGPHLQDDIRDVVSDTATYGKWDMGIFFPPCTYLCRSGARWWSGTPEQDASLLLVAMLLSAPIPKIALENPIGAINSRICKPTQIIQPHDHGHGETKATCLWLQGLPKLHPSNMVNGRRSRVWLEPPSPERSKNRSRTLPGIAFAMAEQWG